MPRFCAYFRFCLLGFYLVPVVLSVYLHGSCGDNMGRNTLGSFSSEFLWTKAREDRVACFSSVAWSGFKFLTKQWKDICLRCVRPPFRRPCIWGSYTWNERWLGWAAWMFTEALHDGNWYVQLTAISDLSVLAMHDLRFLDHTRQLHAMPWHVAHSRKLEASGQACAPRPTLANGHGAWSFICKGSEAVCACCACCSVAASDFDGVLASTSCWSSPRSWRSSSSGLEQNRSWSMTLIGLS